MKQNLFRPECCHLPPVYPVRRLRARAGSAHSERMHAPPVDIPGLTIREEPEGIFYVSISGELGEDLVRVVCAALRRFCERERHVLILVDVTHAHSMSAAARAAAPDEMRAVRLDAVAIVGASFPMRVIMTITTKGVQLLTGQKYALSFFDNEADARAWLNQQRRRDQP